MDELIVALAVIVVVLLVSSVLSERQNSTRKRADPKVVNLLEHLRVYQPNQRMTKQRKLRV